ncbi:unnamed protein product [Hermetia illucens]|uniref:Uncharacterized protein n=1 Tax=Hermetia illucens TaxID=343691 RepID=A0A7R8YWZ3_HERIL|nr:unnamed protein product [Hermetia illucens]
MVGQNTRLGWLISGPVNTANPNQSHYSLVGVQELDDSLKRFWEVEETVFSQELTPEQEECENHYRLTTRWSPDTGRYVVRLPFKPDICPTKMLTSSAYDSQMATN